MPACIEWGTERHQECNATEDRGYNECSASEDRGYRDCCTWAPCSWFCRAWVWISNVVCVAWTWMSNIVCVGWTWITTAVCVLYDIIVTIISAIIVTIESILGWILSGITFIIELLEAIPGIGPIIKWIINVIGLAINFIANLGDVILGIIGIRPEKKLRVCTIIMRDENGVPTASVENVVRALQLAADVYKRDANIRIVPLKPFYYTTGFKGAETVDASWITIDGANSDAEILDTECGGTWILGIAGSRLHLKMSTLCFYGSWRRVLSIGAPVTVFIDRVAPNAVGCSIFGTGFVTVNGRTTVIGDAQQSLRTIGHETGHACLLMHTCVDNEINNMMATSDACDPDSLTGPDRSNPVMQDWQALVVRASRNVSYS